MTIHIKQLYRNQYGKMAQLTNYLKYDNIEIVRLRATPFTPYYQRVNLTLATNGSHFTIRSLKQEEAEEIIECLLHRP